MSNVKTILKITITVLVITSIAGYSLYEARNILRGPVVEVFSPHDGSVLEQSLIEVKGSVKNISLITLNDREITVNEEGVFSEKMLLSPGYNIVKLSVSDRFGRHKEKILELVLSEHESLVSTPSQELN